MDALGRAKLAIVEDRPNRPYKEKAVALDVSLTPILFRNRRSSVQDNESKSIEFNTNVNEMFNATSVLDQIDIIKMLQDLPQGQTFGLHFHEYTSFVIV